MIMLVNIGETWTWFCSTNPKMAYNVRRRVGSFFELNDNRLKQFQHINWRGYENIHSNLKKNPKNPFDVVDFFKFKKSLLKFEKAKKSKKHKLAGAALGFEKRKEKTRKIQNQLANKK